MARTAVVAGTATAVSNRVSRRQGARWAAQNDQQYYQAQQYQADPYPQQQQYQQPQYQEAPAPAAAPNDAARMAALKELGQLKAQGVLTEAEFEAEKARILSTY
jgi:hypothetical protein